VKISCAEAGAAEAAIIATSKATTPRTNFRRLMREYLLYIKGGEQ
jgi:hypothetical protein